MTVQNVQSFDKRKMYKHLSSGSENAKIPHVRASKIFNPLISGPAACFKTLFQDPQHINPLVSGLAACLDFYF
jgi:hypothetical protein